MDTVFAAPKGAVSGDAFKERLAAEAMTVKDFARLTGQSQRMAYGWASGEYPIPQWVDVVLGLLAKVRQASQRKLPGSSPPF